MCKGSLQCCLYQPVPHTKEKNLTKKADSADAHLDVNPTPSELEWGALEREATAHSRGHWGPPAAWLGNTLRKREKENYAQGQIEKKGEKSTHLEIQARFCLKKKKRFLFKRVRKERKG